jgi:hypothetical protein
MNYLRGVQIKTPSFTLGALPEAMRNVRGYSGVQTFFPTLTQLNPEIHNITQEVWMDHAWRIAAVDLSGERGVCSVRIQPNTGASSAIEGRDVYLKVTHLLDPVHWIRGEYSLPKIVGLPGDQATWSKASNKIQDVSNQAYVEAVASYALGRLFEEGITPHFNRFYGAFCANAAKYTYRLTDDFCSYRNDRWFWKGYDKKLFKLVVKNKKNPGEAVPDEVIQTIHQRFVNSDCSTEMSTASSEEELENIILDDSEVREESLRSADSMSDVSYVEDEDDKSASTDDSDLNEVLESYEIYAEFSEYPVMLIFTEKNAGTMEDLLTNFQEVGAHPGMVEWEMAWTAWLFQIVAGLACAQKIIGFTHNDLHTNNIVWEKTEQEFLYYKTGAGVVYRVPTFGRVFKIIDFGRAIYTINSSMYISDDFKEDNDAGEQYAFYPLTSEFEKEVPPNPSFDLCRLAVSLLDSLFPMKPEEIEDGGILSKEKGLVVRETVSELYNLLWSFMIDDKGKNIFINPDESERFPDFDLYKHIAEWVHVAVPAEQVAKPIFKQYIWKEAVDASVKVYPLFC